jgi:CheY-like chemotaxis protein
VTSNDERAAAMRVALPASGYELSMATSRSECLAILSDGNGPSMKGEARYLPDVVLLDSRFLLNDLFEAPQVCMCGLCGCRDER